MSETNETVLATRTPMAIGARGIQINTHDELYRFAGAVCKSDFCPKDFRNDQGSTMVALEFSLELGIPMLQGLQNIAVVNGRASVWGDLMLALVESSGLQEDFFEDFEGKPYDDDYKAICISKRLGRSRPTISQFSVQDAKTAKLWGKQGPWQTNPRRMLQMRARAFCLRDTYADVLRGLYSREEAEDAIDLIAGPQGYTAERTAQNALPPEIAQQLEPPPRHPTLVEIKALQDLMLQAGVAKERLSLELRERYPWLAEGRLTQKYLSDTLTIEHYDSLRDFYAEQLKVLVERDVKSHQPPDMWEEPPETRDDEGLPVEGMLRDGEYQQTYLLGLAERIGTAEHTQGTVDEISKMFRHHKGVLPEQVFNQVEGYLLRRVKVAESGAQVSPPTPPKDVQDESTGAVEA